MMFNIDQSVEMSMDGDLWDKICVASMFEHEINMVCNHYVS